MLTHRELIERNAEWRSDETALIDVDANERYTHRELDEAVNSFANGLRERGVRKGDRVGLVLYNSSEFPISLYACHKLGAVPVPLNFMLAEGDFEYIFTDMSPQIVVYDPDVEAVESAAAAMSESPTLVATGDSPPDEDRFEDLLVSDTEAPPEVPVVTGDPSYILYTSGTTGRPKGVTFTMETAYNRAVEGAIATDLGQDSIALQVSPWFHAGGIDLTVHPMVYAGGTMVATMNWEPEPVASLIERHGVTNIVGVPTVAQRIANLDDVDEYDLSSLEMLICMGSPLSKQLAETIIENVTPNLANGYGTTESLLDAILRPDGLPDHAGTVGRPGPNKMVRVIEHDPSRDVQPDEIVPHGDEGQIIIHGGATLDYYYGNAEATRESLREGWFYTDDMGVIDEDGYLTITGRSDDMILSGGELVSPVEVEETLEKHDGVTDAVVVGTSDEEWGEVVTAYIVAEGVTSEELDEFCKENTGLADFKRPREYHLIDEVERTATGKKQRYKYRE